MSFPLWLDVLSIVSLTLALYCAPVRRDDIATRNRRRMTIVNAVWPIFALASDRMGLRTAWGRGRGAQENLLHAQPECCRVTPIPTNAQHLRSNGP